MSSEMVAVTHADEEAAQDMLNHAFRHVGVSALKDVKFSDIAEAFAAARRAERDQCASELEAQALELDRVERGLVLDLATMMRGHRLPTIRENAHAG